MDERTGFKDSLELLQACIIESEAESLKVFQNWLQSGHFDIRFSTAEFRFLPYLWFRHQETLEKNDVWHKIQGLFKRTYFHNTQLLLLAKQLSSQLDERGITHAFCKGSVYLLTKYPHLGARPMADLDILVHPEDLEKTSSVLEGMQFTPTRPLWESKFVHKHSLGFINSKNLSLDLHTRPSPSVINGFDSRYFLSNLARETTKFGKLPLLDLKKALEFTLLNNLYSRDVHWMLDLLLADPQRQHLTLFFEQLKSFPELRNALIFRIQKNYPSLLPSGIIISKLPQFYIQFLENLFLDKPETTYANHLYWYYGFNGKHMKNPQFNPVYWIKLGVYSLVWFWRKKVGWI